jgi:hypothetical protein
LYEEWSTSDPSVEIERFYRDISPNERGLWCEVWEEWFDTANGAEETPPSDYLANAFSFRSFDQGSTYLSRRENVFCNTEYVSPDPITHAYLEFSGRIAVVKADPADGFFAPTNRFFVGCKFFCYTYTWETANCEWSSDVSALQLGEDESPVPSCDYIIRLSTGDIAFPLYMNGEWGSSTDIIHEAVEWWPYATNAGTPAWDDETGEAINGGPGA